MLVVRNLEKTSYTNLDTTIFVLLSPLTRFVDRIASPDAIHNKNVSDGDNAMSASCTPVMPLSLSLPVRQF